MASELRISGIIEESIVDGPGLRYVVFTQGCPHHCPGCHNPETHSFEGGRMIGLDEVMAQFDENPLLAGMTFSGGEPFAQPGALAELGRMVKERKKNVVTYSGYTIEQLQTMAKQDPDVEALLRQTDLLIDGPFILAERNLDLLFRGSANQRILDLSHYPQVVDVTQKMEDEVKTFSL